MLSSRSTLIALASFLALAACGGEHLAGPAAASGAGGGNDTSHVAPSVVNLSGHVFAVQSSPGGMGNDTLSYVPIAGVPLKLMHNILVNGQSAQELAGTTVSDAAGAYHFNGLPSGYYVLYANPTAGSGYQGGYSLVPAQVAQTVIDVFVWKAP